VVVDSCRQKLLRARLHCVESAVEVEVISSWAHLRVPPSRAALHAEVWTQRGFADTDRSVLADLLSPSPSPRSLLVLPSPHAGRRVVAVTRINLPFLRSPRLSMNPDRTCFVHARGQQMRVGMPSFSPTLDRFLRWLPRAICDVGFLHGSLNLSVLGGGLPWSAGQRRHPFGAHDNRGDCDILGVLERRTQGAKARIGNTRCGYAMVWRLGFGRFRASAFTPP